MKVLSVKDLLNATKGQLIYGSDLTKCENFSTDTRDINLNDVFIGIKGANYDGSKFYLEAFKKGASVCIVDKIDDNNPIDGKTLIIVDDTKIALGQIAKYKRDLYNIPVIAVTGSVGKTSTRDIITSVLSKKYKVLRTEGNLNNDIGLPKTILKLKDEEVLVLEMGMNNFNEISYLSKIASPTIAVITNVGTAHIGNLGSQENIFKAKMEIIDGLTDNGLLIINNDSETIHNNLNKIKCNYMTIGIDNNSDIMAKNINFNEFGSTFSINDREYKISIGGKGYVYNSLMAYAVGHELGIDDTLIKEGINDFKLTKNRMEKLVNKTGTTIINDTYNASYDSVKNAIEVLNGSKQKRKIFVFGSILELGDYTQEIHENIARLILESNIDIVITVGEYAKYTASLLKKNNFKNVYEFDSEEKTYELITNLLTKDDIILLKGSNRINLSNIVEKIKDI